MRGVAPFGTALVAAVGLIAAEAQAEIDGIPDRSLILTCLSENETAPELCRDPLLGPCAYQRRNGQERACTYRLRQHWEQFVDGEIAAKRTTLPTDADRAAFDNAVARQIERRKVDCPLPRDDPATASVRRNACRILHMALFWRSLLQEGH